MPTSRPSIRNQIQRLPPSYKEVVLKQINRAFSLEGYTGNKGPTLDECFSLLGRLQTRLHILVQVTKRINEGLDIDHLQIWCEELWNLKECSQRQIDLLQKIIDLYLAKGEKEFDPLVAATKQGDKIHETSTGTESRGTEPASDSGSSGAVG